MFVCSGGLFCEIFIVLMYTQWMYNEYHEEEDEFIAKDITMVVIKTHLSVVGWKQNFATPFQDSRLREIARELANNKSLLSFIIMVTMTNMWWCWVVPG